MSCFIFWGSHGCSLEANHKGIHVCKDCSEFEITGEIVKEDFHNVSGKLRYQLFDINGNWEWGQWQEVDYGFYMEYKIR